MKYQTAKYADGIFAVNCPHCSNEVAVDESQLNQINTQLSGQYACPIEGCGKEIEFPNAKEAAELKAPTPSSTPGLAVEESEPTSESATPTTDQEPVPAPAPPPQTNPAAKSTQPPAAAPKPAEKSTQPPAVAPKSAPPPNPPASQTQSKSTNDDFSFGFHGSKGASLEREAASVHRISVKTILHSDCVKEKKDTFDETVSKFLNELDEECLMGVHPVQYTADEKKGTDFGVMIIYKLTSGAD